MINVCIQGICKVVTDFLKQNFPLGPGIQEAKSTRINRAYLHKPIDDIHANDLRLYYGVHATSTLNLTASFKYLGLHNVILVGAVDSVNPGDPTLENSMNQ